MGDWGLETIREQDAPTTGISNKIGMLSFTAPLQFKREIQNLKSKIQNPITHDPFLFGLFEPYFEEQILLLNHI